MSIFTMKFFSNPLSKAISNVVTTAIVGVAASAYVASITPNVELAWSESYKHWEFYALIGVALLILIFTYYQAKSEFNALDNAQCKEYVRKQLLPVLVEVVKDDTKNRQPIAKGLNNINQLLEKIK